MEQYIKDFSLGNSNGYMLAYNSEEGGHGAPAPGGHEGANNASTGSDNPSSVFPQLLGGLGDHHTLTIFDKQITELPVIIYDSKEGMHAYSSTKAMTEAGVFTVDHKTHGFVRSSDHHPVSLDASVTNYVMFQWFAMILLLLIFGLAGRKYKKNPNKAPSGLQNLIEVMVVFIRDDVIRPNCGSVKIADRLLPYFITLFFFILFLNLFGLIPGGHTATGAISVTAALAVTAFFVINITAIRETGFLTWLKHLLGGAPVWLAPIMIPIEIISMFTKPFALTIRLFANMTAGHVVLLSLVGLIFYFSKMGLGAGVVLGGIAPISIGFSVFMYFLELLVAFLQAYIFTILTAVFTGLAVGSHAHDEQAHEH
jgi:F-type H+-transporting ATPase subunit a